MIDCFRSTCNSLIDKVSPTGVFYNYDNNAGSTLYNQEPFCCCQNKDKDKQMSVLSKIFMDTVY